ncbi:MAG: Crp/Fnr family transcriptional regulator [Chitinophagales bacterium]|nr:Crp/Fnr family transcriptional regulator [Chitinophagales bacterium]
MWKPLYTNISRHVSLNREDEAVIESLFRHRRYRKKQYLLQEGEICRYESFIIKGCTRTYEAGEKGQEHILQFGLEGWWVGNLYSFLSKTASGYNIDCLEDCEVLQITSTDLENLYARCPVMERFFRIIIQNAFIALQNRILNTLSKPASERYHDFILKYPQIEQRVPDKEIASYLGITPQSLSRIRKNYRSGKLP